MGDIRQPQKVNSKLKKNKIIEAGLKVFSEKGYYNTNTAEIAKVAGVSTGIVYSYFKDKKDIFINSIKLYFTKVFTPISEFLNSIKDPINKKDLITKIVKTAIKSHEDNLTAHEEIIALSHLDKDVHNLFMEFELQVTDMIINFLNLHNIVVNNINERVHLAYNIVENLCHEYIYHKHTNINYQQTIALSSELLLFIFN